MAGLCALTLKRPTEHHAGIVLWPTKKLIKPFTAAHIWVLNECWGSGTVCSKGRGFWWWWQAAPGWRHGGALQRRHGIDISYMGSKIARAPSQGPILCYKGDSIFRFVEVYWNIGYINRWLIYSLFLTKRRWSPRLFLSANVTKQLSTLWELNLAFAFIETRIWLVSCLCVFVKLRGTPVH